MKKVKGEKLKEEWKEVEDEKTQEDLKVVRVGGVNGKILERRIVDNGWMKE